MENFQPAFLWDCEWMLHSPSISMREVLSAFMSEWSTVERSGQQAEIKRVTDFQIYFFCLWSYTFSCLNHCSSAKWSHDVPTEVRREKSPLFEAFLMASCFEQTHVARLKKTLHTACLRSFQVWHDTAQARELCVTITFLPVGMW